LNEKEIDPALQLKDSLIKLRYVHCHAC